MQAQEQTTITKEQNMNTEKPKWMKPAIAVAIVAVIILLGSVISGFINDQEQQSLLFDELDQLNEMSTAEKIDYEAVNEKLGTVVTTGDYVIVEKAMKRYMSDVVAVTKSMEEAMSTPAIVNALSPDNLSAGAPDFTETKASLEAAHKALTEAKAEFQSLMTKERIMSYLEEDVDAKYVALYEELSGGASESEEPSGFNQVIDSIDQMITTIEVEQEALDFLAKNKGRWEIEDGQIFLKTEKLVDEYSAIIAPLFN